MSGREFGLLGATIWQSRRFNALGSDSARLAFCYLISTSHGNINGTYRLNPSYMAADRSITPDQAEADLLDMAMVGLVDYDAREHIIHIRQWFKRNKITNRKHLAGSLRAIEALPPGSPMVGLVAADVLLSAWQSSQGWTDYQAQRDMRRTALQTCEPLVGKHGAIAYFEEITNSLPKDLSIALSEALSIPLSKDHPMHRPPDSPMDRGIDRERVIHREIEDSDTERETEGEGERESADRKRKRPGEPASAPRRAGSPPKGKPGAALAAMADNVIKIAKGRAKPSSILPPDRKQLHAMIDQGLITKTERDTYLSKAEQ